MGPAGIFLALSIIARNTIGFSISGVQIKKESIKEMLLFPPIWGVVLGIIGRILFQDTLLPIIDLEISNIIFEIGIIATLMTVGFSIKKPNLDKFLSPILRVGISRFVVSGLIAIVIIVIFHPPLIAGVPFIVQMMAPPAVYNGLYAEKLELDTELTSQVIVTLTLIALIFLPIELYVLQILYL